MKYLRFIENNLVTIFFLLGVLVNLVGIALRFFPSVPQYWVPETYTLLFLFAIFIGFGTALRDGKHIIIDIIDRYTSFTTQKIITLVSYLISLAFTILLMISGYFIVVRTFEQGLTTADLGLPVWLVYSIMPLSGLLMSIHLIYLILKLRERKEN